MTPALGTLGALLATTKSSSSGTSTLLVFVVIGAGFYFLIYRPQQRKQKANRAMANAYEVGDEVVTAGGIVGRVLDITDDRVTLETSVGASFTVLKPYVLRKLEPAEPPPDVVGDESDHYADDDEPAHESDDAPEPPSGPPTDSEPPSGGPTDKDSDGTEASGSDGPPII
jgi:preprotein translocase subunit YajC